ncbi:alpha/beta fold hydrolase [Paraoerskovia marina]|uniref:alpha/beta fold hydrolase n=1 Tax=Paraoerskovia marina TaxID=545619 RepID=UPI000693A03F|nr:alpha/beta hydrolase [Paraoerskovia marina]
MPRNRSPVEHGSAPTILLIPGAGGDASVFSELAPELERRGYRAIPLDLPAQDESLGWTDQCDLAVEALDPADDVVVLALSMGAYVGALVCERRPVHVLVLLNPMIPLPGESAGEWWDAVGHERAREAAGLGPFDPVEGFFHDVPDAVRRRALAAAPREPSARSFAEPWPATRWPGTRTVVVQGRDDRLFPPELQRRVARERLGLDVVEMPGGHLLPLSRPGLLADVLEREI